MENESRYNELKNLLTNKEKSRTEFEKQVPLIVEWFINKMHIYFACDRGCIRFNEFYKDKKYKFNVTLRIPFETEDPYQNRQQIKDFEFSFYFKSPDSNTVFSDDFDETLRNRGLNINNELNNIFDIMFKNIRVKIEHLY